MFASAKSQTMGIACLPKRFMTFWLPDVHRHNELLKSEHRSTAKDKNVATTLEYSVASMADCPASWASLNTSLRTALTRSLSVTIAIN